MKSIIIILMFIGFLSCASAASENKKPITAKEARHLNAEHHTKQYKINFRKCESFMNERIRLGSMFGESHVHYVYGKCYGDMLKKLEQKLIARGFKTNLQSVGVLGTPYLEILTITWHVK